MATDWKNLPATLDNALKALDTMTGDPDAAALIRNTLTFQHNERRRLEADNTRLRSGGGSPRTGKRKKLAVVDGAYTRDQPVIVMTWTCAICGKSHQREQLPGNTPKYCLPSSGEKQSDCQREATRRRVAAHRRGQKTSKQSVTTPAKPVTVDHSSLGENFRLRRKHLPLLHKAASRNGQHYIGRESSSSPVLRDLVAAGLAVVVETKGQRTYYRLTEDGLKASATKSYELPL